MSLTKVSYSMINGAPISVVDFGAVGDYDWQTNTGTNSTAAFQAAATKCDIDGLASCYIPNCNEDYLISAPIVFREPGISIFGTGGAGGGDRGVPRKKGKVYLANGVTHAFDLGGSRTTGNVADNWTIKNIAVMAAVANQTADAIRFTSRTDGPDRGAIVRECSATFMNAGVSIPSRGTSSALATLVVENCVFTSNNYALLALSGNIYGARIVGNQLEQNLIGGIYGSFNGPVYIADNMLEGQPNAITLTNPEVVGGNTINAVIERNYFESNGGSWVIKLFCGADTSLTVRNNNWAGITATDDIVLTSSGNCLLTVEEEVFRPVIVTFTEHGGVISYGSSFLNNVQSFFYVRQFSDNNNASFVITADYQNFVNPLSSTSVESQETGIAHYDTPYGIMACAGYNEDVAIPLSVIVNDAIQLNIFCKIETGAFFIIEILNSTKTAVFQRWTAYSADQITVNGRWALVTIPFLSSGISNGLFLRVTAQAGSTGNFLTAGVSAVNAGQHINDGTDVVEMRPLMPNRVVSQIGSNYEVTSVSGATAIVDTLINPTLNQSGVATIANIYDVVISGRTDSSTNLDSSIAYGVVTVFNTGASFTMAYTQTSAVGDNPLTVTAVFWNGVTETSTFAGGNIQMRIKVAGYLNNTGNSQTCRIIKRL